MNYSWIILTLVYIAISWFFVTQCDKDEYDAVTKIAVSILWPLIVGCFLLAFVILITIGLVHIVISFMYKIVKILTGGDSNGVV